MREGGGGRSGVIVSSKEGGKGVVKLVAPGGVH